MQINIERLDEYEDFYNKTFSVNKSILESSICYEYNDEYGYNKILIYDNKVKIFRKGEITSGQTFIQGEDTSFIYFTKEMTKTFLIKTKKLDIKYGKIFIEYELYEDNIRINTLKVNLTECN